MPKASSNPTQRPKRRAPEQAPVVNAGRDRFERVLAVAVVVLGVIAVLGFAGTLLHVAFRDGVPFFAGVAWQYAYWLPLLALPAMIVCVIVLVIVNARGKARTHRA